MIRKIVDLNEKFSTLLSKIALKDWQVVLILFFFSLALNTLFMNSGLWHHDSVLAANAVEKTLDTHSPQPSVFGGRYGFVLINTFFYSILKLFGFSLETSLNFVSGCLFGALSIAMIYLFVKEFLKDRITAFFSALFFSVTPVFLSISTYGKEHAMEVFFLVSALYFLLKSDNSVLMKILSGLSLGIAVTVREANLLYIPLFVLLYIHPTFANRSLSFDRNKFKLKNMLLTFSGLIVILAIILFTYVDSVIFSAKYNSFLGFFSPLLPSALYFLSISVVHFGWLFVALGIIYCFISKKGFELFFLLSSIIFLLCYFGNNSAMVARYLLIIILFLIILSSLGIKLVFDKSKLLAVTLSILFVVSMFMVVYPAIKFRHSYCGEKEFALFVKDKTEPNAVIISMDDGVFIQFYGNRTVINHPIGDVEKTKEWIKEIKGYLNNQTPVYIMDSGFSYDPGGIVQTALLSNFNLVLVGTKLSEDYHQNELSLGTYDQRLFRVDKK